MAAQDVFTYTLTNGTFTVTGDFGLTVVALNLVSGSGSFVGTKKIGSTASTSIALVVDDPITISADENGYISSLVITALAGVVQIIGR